MAILWPDFLFGPINLWKMPKMINEHDIKDMMPASHAPSIENTLAERGKRYGSFASHAKIAQALKGSMWNTPVWPFLADDQKQSLEVIADKVARILNGDPNYLDNWHDIIGYAKLVEDRLNAEQKGSTR